MTDEKWKCFFHFVQLRKIFNNKSKLVLSQGVEDIKKRKMFDKDFHQIFAIFFVLSIKAFISIWYIR